MSDSARRYLTHPDTVERAARALERADLRLRWDLTWLEMDEVEQDDFREAARIVLTEAAEGLAP